MSSTCWFPIQKFYPPNEGSRKKLFLIGPTTNAWTPIPDIENVKFQKYFKNVYTY